MAFDVYHNPSAAALGGVAFQGGRGEYQKYLQQHRLQQQQLALRQQQMRIGQQQFAQEMQERGRQREFQTERDRQLQEFQLEELNERQRIEQQNFEHKFTSAQKLRMQQIRQDIEEVEQDDTLTPEQKMVTKQRLKSMIYGMGQLPIPKAESPYPEGQAPGQNWVDRSGALMTRDSKGDAKMLVPPPKLTDLFKQATEALTTTRYNPETMQTEEVAPSFKEISDRVEEMMTMHRKMMGQLVEDPRNEYDEALSVFDEEPQFEDDVLTEETDATIRQGLIPGLPGGRIPGMPDVIQEFPEEEARKLQQGKPANGGDWVGRVWDMDQTRAKLRFRDMNAAVISRAMAQMNQPGVPKAVRGDLREAVQELLKILKAADYEVPAENPHQFVSRSLSEEGVKKRERAEELASYLVDFINNPQRFAGGRQ